MFHKTPNSIVNQLSSVKFEIHRSDWLSRLLTVVQIKTVDCSANSRHFTCHFHLASVREEFILRFVVYTLCGCLILQNLFKISSKLQQCQKTRRLKVRRLQNFAYRYKDPLMYPLHRVVQNQTKALNHQQMAAVQPV